MARYKAPTYNPKSSNYNSKPRKSFGSRIKNFFSVDIEKDLQKKENTKVFQRIKLFTLNRYNLFVVLALFFVIVNLLVVFNLNQFYIRAILAFVFLITIPGLLLMLIFKIREVGFWEYLVYTVGLSVAFIMFAGLAVNWILPWLHITDKPLSLYPILICFDIFLLIMSFFAYKRNSDLRFKTKFPKFTWLDRIFMIIPMFFPVLAVLGAFILNNHGSNILTMIMIGTIAVYVLMVVIFRDKLNENVFPWALYWMGLALLLMYSMRSWYFMGNDVVLEYHFFDLILKNGLWSIKDYINSYNACLSVNIFPAIINTFVNTNPLIIFKLIIQIFFPIILIIVYLFSNKFSNKFISFLAGFFFLSQGGYLIEMISHIRQEVAFVFFGLMLLVLFTKEINPTPKKLLFIIFGFSMIVSHYSTSYIALAIFLLTYILTLLYKIYENRRIKKGKLKPKEKQQFYLTGILLLLLLIFGFLWYGQVTPTANDLIDFTEKSISNFNNLFNQDFQSQGQSFSDQFRLRPIQKDYTTLINEEIETVKLSNLSDLYSGVRTQEASIRAIPMKSISPRFSYGFVSIFYLFLSLIKRIGYILILIGLIYCLVFSKIKRDSNIFLMSLMGIISFSLIVIVMIIPFGSISYGVFRLYQQGLIILSIFGVIGLILVFNKTNKSIRFLFIWIFLIIYFLSVSGFCNQIVGGNSAFSSMNNFGGSYDIEYISKTEISSTIWLSSEDINKKLYASRMFPNLFKSFGSLPYPDYNVFPQILKKDSYVYAGNSEVFEGKGFITLSQFGAVSFNFPINFLNDNKNKIYNNGGSEIFK